MLSDYLNVIISQNVYIYIYKVNLDNFDDDFYYY